MIRIVTLLTLFFCCTAAWGQFPVYPGVPQPFYGPPGYGYGGYGYGGYHFGVRGYYPPSPYGNLNWLPPNPPSPYYVVPSAAEYRAQQQRLDQANYGELLLLHSMQQRN